MTRRLLGVAVVVAVVAAACGSDRVRLAYGIDPGRTLVHELTLTAVVRRTLAGDPREQRLSATFRTRHTVLGSSGAEGSRARVTLEPLSLSVDGRPATPGPAQEFVLLLGGDGRVQRIEAASGQPADVLAPVGVDRLIPRLRPVLPPGPVTPGDRWGSETRFGDEAGEFSLSVSSQLASLGVVDGRDAALIRSSYTSPVDRRETFSNAVATIEGRDQGNQAAWFALDGYLVRSTGDSVGQYRVEFRPPGGDTALAPVRGSLSVRLHTDMRLVS